MLANCLQMKILSNKSFSRYHSPGVSLFGLVFAPPERKSRLPLTIYANTSKCRTRGMCRLPYLFQLLSLCIIVCTILVYAALTTRTSAGESPTRSRLFGSDGDNECLFLCDSDKLASEQNGGVVHSPIVGPGAKAKAVTDNAIPPPQAVHTNELPLFRNKKTISANLGKPHHHKPNHRHNPSANRNSQSAIIATDEVSNHSELFYDYGGAMRNREQLDNVFLSVKSTKRFHSTRLDPILKTWFNLAKNQTWFFTDDDDPELAAKSNGHLVHTRCPPTHYRQALCCKMASEFDTFLQTTKSWFCHFDDDNYVNVPALLSLLGRYNPREYWYLGKPSLKSPIRIKNPDNNHTEEVSFWFATGGAGFCLSRALALRMSPLASGGKFMKACDKIQLPDDVTMGYIAGHLLGRNLTVIPQFHSHFETMKFVDTRNPATEITFSYVRHADYQNILDIEGLSEHEDPTRFLSLHCRLFPRSFAYCSHLNQNRAPRPTAEGEYSGAAYYKK